MVKIFSWLKRRREYYVPFVQDDAITPEETLVDSVSEYSDMEQPISDGVFKIALFALVAIVLVILAQTVRFSVVRHEYFSELAFKNKTVNFTMSPSRGIIFDYQGRPLVENTPSFDVLVVSRELPRNEEIRKTQLDAIADALNVSEPEFVDDILVQSKKQSVFFVALDISKEKVLELRRINMSGIYVITNTKRSYLSGRQFSAIVGYTGKVNKNDLAADNYYLQSDSIGRQGIEAMYEQALRGKHGVIYFTRGSEGDVVEDPVPGENVVLNIDYDAQKVLWNALYKILHDADLSSAAAIVQDPRSGAVLAMTSFPDYDNNIFTSAVSQEEYARLFENKSRPLFNRVISGLYNPGSTIKPFIGMAALQEKIVTSSDAIRDCVSISIPNPINPDEPYVYKNWRVDLGLFNLKRAIANSCNIYFFTVGGGNGSIDGLGVRKITQYLKASLADSVLGIDLPGEEQGFLPTPEWKLKTNKENWYQGDTYNISIGQGDLLLTPLWINSYISAVANKGTIYKPQIASKIIDSEKAPIEIFKPIVLGELPFEKSVIEEMRFAMRETVRSGTAKSLQDLPVQAAAKTGTAEVVKGKSMNSLFTVFAPFDSPEIALTVLVEGSSASNQSYAIQAAEKFLRWYFSTERKTNAPANDTGQSENITSSVSPSPLQ